MPFMSYCAILAMPCSVVLGVLLLIIHMAIEFGTCRLVVNFQVVVTLGIQKIKPPETAERAVE